MKKFWPIALLFLCLVAVSSCGKDDDDKVVVDEVWKLQNEEAFQAIASDPAYTELKSLGNDGSIYYQVMKEGTNKMKIFFSDSVRIYYTGRYYDGEVFDSKEPPYDPPFLMTVYPGKDGMIEGLALAMQYLHIGDRWNVWIPYQLAYGAEGMKNNSGKVLIKGCSTLNFEVEVASVIRNGVEYTNE